MSLEIVKVQCLKLYYLKMKVMYPLMTEVAQKLTKYISEQNDATTSTGLDAKDVSKHHLFNKNSICQ